MLLKRRHENEKSAKTKYTQNACTVRCDFQASRLYNPAYLSHSIPVHFRLHIADSVGCSLPSQYHDSKMKLPKLQKARNRTNTSVLVKLHHISGNSRLQMCRPFSQERNRSIALRNRTKQKQNDNTNMSMFKHKTLRNWFIFYLNLHFTNKSKLLLLKLFLLI